MNRIYKTIWNAATQSWTVAGELASLLQKAKVHQKQFQH